LLINNSAVLINIHGGDRELLSDGEQN